MLGHEFMGDVVEVGSRDHRLKVGDLSAVQAVRPAELIMQGKIDPTFLITHGSRDLGEGPELYTTFRDRKDGCVKVVFDLS